jgi:16S rRNA (uracil1498-N3)-methyltransferase
MQFVYHENASSDTLSIQGDMYKYLFKIRRHNIEDKIAFRNLKDEVLYFYDVVNISKKEALLRCHSKEIKPVMPSKSLHLLWSVLDPKTIEKQLPYLNEMGVKRISFIYADYSQKNFKLNFDKFEKILVNSCQQCGRSELMELDLVDSLDAFLEEFPHTYMLNFSSTSLNNHLDIETIFIGCEGGFSQKEIEKFDKNKTVGLNSNLILRSQTAASAVAAKILL